MSEISKAHIFCFEITKCKNYINVIGKNPTIGDVIDWQDIVFNREELIDSKWMFLNNEVLEEARQQVEELRKCNDWVAILE